MHMTFCSLPHYSVVTLQLNLTSRNWSLSVETNLTPGDYKYKNDDAQTTHVVIDFMSKLRQFPKLRSTFTNFGELIQEVLKHHQH